jgi:hypothetical protein
MTTETPETTLVIGIVACGTCDNVFRAHQARQTCPTCGGDPAFLIVDLTPTQSEPSPAAPPSDEETLAEPAAAEVTPSESAPSSDTGPSAAAGDGTSEGAPAVGQEGTVPSGRRRSRP